MVVMMKVAVQTEAKTTVLLLLSCSQLKGDRVVEIRKDSPPQKAAQHRPPAAAHLPLQPPSLLPSLLLLLLLLLPLLLGRLPPCPPASRAQPGQAAAEIPPDTGAATGRGRRGGKGKRGAKRLGEDLPPPPKRRRALRREDAPARRRRLATGGGRRFKPAWGWEGGGRRRARMRHGCLCEERRGEGGGAELPGRERSPRLQDEGERREKARGEVQRRRFLPGNNSISGRRCRRLGSSRPPPPPPHRKTGRKR